MEYGFNFNRSRPDKDKYRVAWNKSWEADLQKYYNGIKTGATPRIRVSQSTLTFMSTTAATESIELQRHVQTEEICQLQKDIRAFAIERADEIGERWGSLGPKSREELILLAFYKVSTASPDMEAPRMWCPEMTTSTLSANGGHYFMETLDTIVGDGPDVEDGTMINFPNPAFEYLFGDPTFKALEAIHRNTFTATRTYFISFVIWRILLALFDLDETAFVVNGPKQKYSNSNVLELARESGNPSLMRTVKKEMKQFKNDKATAVDICWGCKEHPSLLPANTKLKACAKCKAIGRIVKYCSRECQWGDWKYGLPQPHKAICGKLFEDNPAATSPPPKSEIAPCLMIPKPDPYYKRSPELLHQIQLMKENKHCDYMLVQDAPNENIGIRVPEVPDMWGRLAFLVLRRRAFESGDKCAVNQLFDVLRIPSKRLGVPVANTKKQLEKEYPGVTIIEDIDLREWEVADFEDDEFEWAQRLLDSADQ